MARVEAGFGSAHGRRGGRHQRGPQQRSRGVAIGLLVAGLALLGWPIVTQGAASADDEVQTIGQTGTFGPQTVTVTPGDNPAQTGRCGPGAKGHVVKFTDLSSSPASDAQATFGSGVGGRMSFSLRIVGTHRTILIRGLRKSATTYSAGTAIYASSITVLKGNAGKTFTFERPVSNTTTDLGGDAPGSYWLDPNITSGVINQVMVCAIDPAETGVSDPDMTITKTQTNSGPFALNQTISYTITALNTGSLLFSPFTITDPNAIISSCTFTTQNAAHGAGTDANLADGYTTVLDPADTGDDGNANHPADLITCSASHKVTQADLDADATYVNTATGTGAYRNVGNVNGATSTRTESAGATSTLARTASITLAKTATTTGPFHVGDTIAYTVVATNNGTVTLTGVVVSDPNATIGACTLAGGATLVAGTFVMPPGATVTCAATKTVTEASLAADDTVKNVATVTANPPTGMPAVNATDDDTRAVLVQRSLSIVKSVTSVTNGPSATSYDTVGDVINYGIVVTNTGDVALPDVTVSDPAVALSCTPAAPAASLAAGASITCTGAHTVTQADLDAGSSTNTASADSGATEPVSDGATATAVQSTSIQLSKQVTAVDDGIDGKGSFLFDTPGDVVHYSIVATNDGNVTLTDVVVTDASAAGLDCSAAPGNQTTVATLAPGASVTCTATYTVSQGDIDAGHHLNTATVDSDQTEAATAEVDVAADQHPTIGIDKSQVGGPSPFDATGAELGYEILITNTGNVTLANVAVTDADAVGLDCSSAVGMQTGVASLAPGAAFTCTAGHVTTQVDLDGGGYSNTARAGADNAPTVSDTVVTDAARNPGIDVSKVVSDEAGTTYSAVGDRITFAITVLNTGNVTVHGVAVADPNAVIQCDSGTTLAPGASRHCDAIHDVTQADLDAGRVLNVATATVDELAQPVSDEVTVTLATTPLATIAKTFTSKLDHFTAVGDVLPFAVVVTNAGNVTLHHPVVTDPTAPLSCGVVPATLAPGATITCTASHVVTQADLDAGHYTNTATVATDETEPAGDDVVVPAWQLPELSLVKAATAGVPYTAAGQAVSFTLTVTNVGNVTLAGVVVSDANATGIDCNAASEGATDTVDLAVGEAVVCTATHIVTQADMDAGEFDNTAIAAIADDVFIDDTITVEGAPLPAMSIVKTVASGSPYAAPGDEVAFTVTVTNTGTTTLQNVSVSDPLAGTLDCDPEAAGAQVDEFTLAPAAALTCTAVHVVNQADVDDGSFVNTATADSDSTKPVSATATAIAREETVGSLVVDKRVAATPAPPVGGYTVGSVITWTIEVTNNGDVTLTNLHVTDDFADLDDCTPAAGAGLTKVAAVAVDAVVLGGSLAPGASFTCTATHTVTQGDIDDGSYTNLATASGEGPNGDVENPEDDIVAADDDTVTLPYNPSIVVTKTVTSTGPYVLNSTLAYSIVVTNNGTVTLANVGVSEQAGVTLGTCTPAAPVATLAPGATVTCTATHTVTNTDLAAGTYRNVVTTRGFANRQEREVTDTDTVDQAMVVADLAIGNSVSPGAPTAGQQLVYVLTVDNNGPSVATDLVVLDPLPAGLTLVSASGDGWACTGTTTVRCTRASAGVGESLPPITVVVQSAAALQGLVSNTATVSGSRFDPVAANNVAPAEVTFAQVLAEVITDTPTTVAVLDANLPRTGAAGTSLMLRFGALLTAAGATLLLVGRRRPVRRPLV